MKNLLLRNKLPLIIAVMILIIDIVYIAINNGDHTFAWLTFILALVGVAILIGGVFLPKVIKPFVPFFAAVALGIGFAQQFYVTLETLSDVWNGVSFIGGSPAMGVTFDILFFLAALGAIILCFRKEKETE